MMKSATGNRANKQNVNLAELLAEAILSARSDPIVATDRDGIIRFWNRVAERVFGRSRQEAVGRSLDLIIPERLRQRHWEGFAKVMRSGQSRHGERDLLPRQDKLCAFSPTADYQFIANPDYKEDRG